MRSERVPEAREAETMFRGGLVKDFIGVILFMAVYFAVMKFVLPALGVQT